MAKPCNCCSKVLNLCRIKRVYYTGEDGEIVKEKGVEIKNDHLSSSYRAQAEGRMA